MEIKAIGIKIIVKEARTLAKQTEIKSPLVEVIGWLRVR
jgi:hypothetical protein